MALLSDTNPSDRYVNSVLEYGINSLNMFNSDSTNNNTELVETIISIEKARRQKQVMNTRLDKSTKYLIFSRIAKERPSTMFNYKLTIAIANYKALNDIF